MLYTYRGGARGDLFDNIKVELPVDDGLWVSGWVQQVDNNGI